MAANNRDLLLRGARQLNLDLSEEGLELLLRYLAELLKWRQKVNLIARDTPEPQVVENHFLDSLSLLPLLQGLEVHLLDVGSGAGFPGLALACVLPQARFTLVEPRLKRVSFLRHVIRSLGLKNVEVVADRIEPHLHAWQGRFTHITSRAVADPGNFLPLIGEMVRPQTQVVLMLAHAETLAGVEYLDEGGWQIIEQHQLRLPFSGAPRLLAVVSRR